MPIAVVNKYHSLYYNYFHDAVMRLHGAKTVKPFDVPVYDDLNEIGFKGNKLRVMSQDLGMDILSANVTKKSQSPGRATIHLSNELLQSHPRELKYHAAHEWLEVMYYFHYGKNLRDKSVSGRTDYIQFLCGTRSSRTPWQDTIDDYRQLDIALRCMLVPKSLVSKYLDEKGYPLNSFRNKAASDPAGAGRVILDVEMQLSEQWKVDKEVVHYRVDEILFDHTMPKRIM